VNSRRFTRKIVSYRNVHWGEKIHASKFFQLSGKLGTEVKLSADTTKRM